MEIINGYPAKYWRRLDRWYLRIATALIAAFVLLSVVDWLQEDDAADPIAASAPNSAAILASVGSPTSASGSLEQTSAPIEVAASAPQAPAAVSAPAAIASATAEPAGRAAKTFEARWSGGKLHFYGHLKDYRQAELVRQQAGAALGFANVSDSFVIDGVSELGPWQTQILALASWFRGKPDGTFSWQDNTIVLSGTVRTAAERTARVEWVRNTFGMDVQLKNDIVLVGQTPAPASSIESAVSAVVTASVSVPASISSGAPPAPAAVTASKPAPVVVASSPPTPTAIAAISAPAPAPFAEAEVQAALQAWRSAWAASDVASYTASYTADFKGDLASNAAWRAQRQQRITAAGKISVELTQIKLARLPTLTPTLERAQAVFMQNYSSVTLRQSGEKTLLLVKQNGRWLIEKESFRAQ